MESFPGLAKTVSSFNDLYDGLVLCQVLKQINDSFSYPSVSDTTHVTEDESKALFNAIQSFMQSEIVDDSNSDPVFNAEAIYRDHDNEEVLFLVKLILGVAMQSEKSSVIVSQITSLDKDTQDTLMQLLKDVLASMQPDTEPGEEDDGPLKTFDEILQEYPDMEDEEDDWHDWDADSPLHGVEEPSPGVDYEQLLEEKDKQIRDLQNEVAQRDVMVEELERVRAELEQQRAELTATAEKLGSEVTELKKEKVQQQMKLDELAADPAAMRELHEQFVMMQEEVEKAEEENRALKLRVAELTRTVESASGQREMAALRAQLEQQAEELAGLQKYKELYEGKCQELQQLQRSQMDQGEVVSQNCALKSTVEAVEARLAKLEQDKKEYLDQVLAYQAKCQALQEKVREREQRESELKEEVQRLRQGNESLQVLLSPEGVASAPLSPSNSASLQDLLRVSHSEAVQPATLSATPSNAEPSTQQGALSDMPSLTQLSLQPVDVKSSREYLDLANELLVAKERCVSLNQKIESLSAEVAALKEAALSQTADVTATPSGESVPYEQFHLMVIKAQVKDEEIESLKKQAEKADSERVMCLKKIEELQTDYQEMTENLTSSVAKCRELEEKRKQMASKFKAVLIQLQQLDAARKSTEEQLEEAKHRNETLFNSYQREEEAMFHCVHTLGNASLMQAYLRTLREYKPKGWLARMRASQARVF
ncbi:hypothetical protein WA556_001868 [Blastocystis sp. ATCC 50177/Nand II]